MTRVARCSCLVEQVLGQSSVIDSLRMPKAKSCAMGHPQQPAGSAIGWHARVLTQHTTLHAHSASRVSCLVLLFWILRDSFSPFHLMIWISKCANVFFFKNHWFQSSENVLNYYTYKKTSWFCLASRLFEAGQDELSGTELLIQRQEELHRLQARLSRASIYPGEDPRASIMDLVEPLRNSPLEAGLHPRKSKVMQCSWI